MMTDEEFIALVCDDIVIPKPAKVIEFLVDRGSAQEYAGYQLGYDQGLKDGYTKAMTDLATEVG